MNHPNQRRGKSTISTGIVTTKEEDRDGRIKTFVQEAAPMILLRTVETHALHYLSTQCAPHANKALLPLQPRMATVVEDGDDLRITLPIEHPLTKPPTPTYTPSAEDMEQHGSGFIKAENAIKRIAEPFMPLCTRASSMSPGHATLICQIPDFRVATDILFDRYFLHAILSIQNHNNTPTVMLDLLPEELLHHLITTDTGDGTVRLDSGPLDSFAEEDTVTLHRLQIYLGSDNTYYYKSLTYVCAIDDFDAKQQALVAKIIRNTLAPLTRITESITDLSITKDEFARRSMTHKLMMLLYSQEKQAQFFQISDDVWNRYTKKHEPVTRDMIRKMLRQCGAEEPICMQLTPGHSEHFHNATRAIFEIASPFESENVELGSFAADQLSLTSSHLINITLSVTNQSTVQLTIRPAELLGHLAVSHQTNGTVMLKKGPPYSFPTKQTLVLTVEKESINLGKHTCHFKTWKYECDIHQFDPDRQALIKKVIQNALTPFTRPRGIDTIYTATHAEKRHTTLVQKMCNELQLPRHVQGPYTCAKTA